MVEELRSNVYFSIQNRYENIYLPKEMIKLNLNRILFLIYFAGSSFKLRELLSHSNKLSDLDLQFYEFSIPSLKNLVRIELRKHLMKVFKGKLFYQVFDRLNIPDKLISFLKLKDISYIYGPENKFDSYRNRNIYGAEQEEGLW